MRMPVGRVWAIRRPSVHDRRDRQPGDRRHAIGRVLEDALAERVPAHRVPVDEVAILGALAEHDVQQAERQRRVGAGQRRQVPVAGRGGARPHRIDGDDLRALAARLEDRAPQVRMRRQHVGAPDDHQLRAAQRLRIHADAVVAERVAGAEAAGDRADGLHVLRGAEHVPQPPAGAVGAVEQAHVAGADVGPDGLAAVGGDDRPAAASRSDRGPRPTRCARTRRGPSGRRAASGRGDGRQRACRPGSRRPCCRASRGCTDAPGRRAGPPPRRPAPSRSSCRCRGSRARRRRAQRCRRQRSGASPRSRRPSSCLVHAQCIAAGRR